MSYPDHPSSKVGGPSAAAAAFMAREAETLRRKSYDILMRRNCTADEVAYRLNTSVLAIRPRLSELRAKELIFDSGKRRVNVSGRSATVWTVRRPQEDGAAS